jgi:signal peptidase I
MSPSILPGDRILLNKAVYNTQAIKLGDVVIFTYPDDRRLNYVKRIAALPGDTVEIRENILLVNDLPLDNPIAPGLVLDFKPEGAQIIMMEENAAAIHPIMVDSANPQNMAKITVPHGHCFLLGDNRSQSTDSRNFGPVPTSDIQGRLDYIYWPAKSWSRLGLYPHK